MKEILIFLIKVITGISIFLVYTITNFYGEIVQNNEYILHLIMIGYLLLMREELAMKRSLLFAFLSSIFKELEYQILDCVFFTGLILITLWPNINFAYFSYFNKRDKVRNNNSTKSIFNGSNTINPSVYAEESKTNSPTSKIKNK